MRWVLTGFRSQGYDGLGIKISITDRVFVLLQVSCRHQLCIAKGAFRFDSSQETWRTSTLWAVRIRND